MSKQEKQWLELMGDMAAATTRAATDVAQTVVSTQIALSLMPFQMFLRR